MIYNANMTNHENAHVIQKIKVSKDASPITHLLKCPDENYIIAISKTKTDSQ